MKQSERIAITRIIADLIKADNIIDAGEMDYYALLKEEYSITKDVELQATTMTLAEAVKHLSVADRRTQSRFLEHCEEMTVSDGFCAPVEAILVIAIRHSVQSGCEDAEIISTVSSSLSINKGQALYVESHYNEDVNKAIVNGYRCIDNELRLGGFDFIYIPHIVKHYVQYRDNVFNDVANFLAPILSDDEITDLRLKLTSMTTARFCREQLCSRLGMKTLSDTVPSLLIKVNEDIVGGEFHENFFRIEVDPSVCYTVQQLMDEYVGMLSSDMQVVSHIDERENQFLYHGFYRLLFDMYTIRNIVKCHIEINPWKGEIRFPEINRSLSGLRRKEKAFYVLLLIESATYGGVSFNQPASAKQFENYQMRMNEVMMHYNKIYEMFGGEKDAAPDLTKPEIRRPIISIIRNNIQKLSTELRNSSEYNIEKNKEGVFCINVEKSLVKILTSKGYIPLTELKKCWETFL